MRHLSVINSISSNRFPSCVKAMILAACLALVFFSPRAGECKDSADNFDISLDQIMEKIENKYNTKGFSAEFFQKSTIKAINITDTASGNLFVKSPGMMRWEYKEPDKQLIITDGKKLWVYRKNDNQVMIGTSPYFFGNGKGSGFLSDMKIIRQEFDITLDTKTDNTYYMLKLIPKEKMFDISLVSLWVSRNNFNIVQIATYNLYDDETKIYLKNINFKKNINDSMFYFTIPEGADILQLDK